MGVSSDVKLGTQIITICVHFSNLSSFDWCLKFTLLDIIQIWMWQCSFTVMFVQAETHGFLMVPRIVSFVNSKIHLFS